MLNLVVRKETARLSKVKKAIDNYVNKNSLKIRTFAIVSSRLSLFNLRTVDVRTSNISKRRTENYECTMMFALT